jgi:hypothetical protein
MTCEICGGSERIRLPRRMAVTAYDPHTMPATIEDASKTYPCPECAPSIPQDRLAIVRWHSMIDARIEDPEYIAHARKHAAIELGVRLLRGGLIAFRDGPEDATYMTRPMVATVGVASPTQVATFEQRVAAKQDEFAREVVRVAVASINGWGSHYGDKFIDKDIASRLTREALRTTPRDTP